MEELEKLAAVLATDGAVLELGLHGVHRLTAEDALRRPLYLRMTNDQLRAHLARLADDDLTVIWPDVDQQTAAFRLFLVHFSEELFLDNPPSDYVTLREDGLRFDVNANPYKYTWSPL